MLVAAAVCPCPPLIVPAVAAGAAGELTALREAAASALDTVRAAEPDLLVAVGPEDAAHHPARMPVCEPDWGRDWKGGAVGSFAPVGVALSVRLGPDDPGSDEDEGVDGAEVLPLSLAVGCVLLRAVAWPTPVCGRSLTSGATAAEYAAIGAELAVRADRLALLILGDGSARRSATGPGHLDPRAEDFDAEVARALADGSPDALAAVDGALAADLLAAGWPTWQVLAGAARGGTWRAELLHDAAPYGVAYPVASWVRG